MPKETELQRRIRENQLPRAVPFNESINPEGLVPRVIAGAGDVGGRLGGVGGRVADRLINTTPGQKGEAVGRFVSALPQANANLVGKAANAVGFNQLADFAKGTVRGVFGTEDIRPGITTQGTAQDQQAQRRELIHRSILNSDTPILQNQPPLKADALTPVASQVAKAKKSTTPGAVGSTGNTGEARRQAAQSAVNAGDSVEVIRGLDRSQKIFGQTGPGQDGEFRLSDLLPGALEGQERLARAGGSETALAADARAKGLVQAAGVNAGAANAAGSIQRQVFESLLGEKNPLEALQILSQASNPLGQKEQLFESLYGQANKLLASGDVEKISRAKELFNYINFLEDTSGIRQAPE